MAILDQRKTNSFKSERIGLVTTVGVLEVIFTILIIQIVLLLLYGFHNNTERLIKQLSSTNFQAIKWIMIARIVVNITGLIGGFKILKQHQSGRTLILISCFAVISLFLPNFVLYTTFGSVFEITEVFALFSLINLAILIWNISAIFILLQRKVKDNLY